MSHEKECDEVIQGLDELDISERCPEPWTPSSDRKIRMGIAGHGLCCFGPAFFLQDHPNVEVVAVADLFPERNEALAKACRCDKKYPSVEEMAKDDTIEAIFVATDAPSHSRHCLAALENGKHVATAVPAVHGEAGMEDADRLMDCVKRTGLNYMMFETSYYHSDLYAMRKIYEAGGFGELVYSEGQYFHYHVHTLDSHKGWRVGIPPQWYPTHATAYHVGVTGGSFTEVSCMGIPSIFDDFQPGKNAYGNIFDTEIALFRTSEGGIARMGVSWGTQGAGTESGHVRGQRGSWNVLTGRYEGEEQDLPELRKPQLPPGLADGGHGGSHGDLGNEFVSSILEERTPEIDIAMALNMTVPGIIAHRSACKDGELLAIPQYSFDRV